MAELATDQLWIVPHYRIFKRIRRRCKVSSAKSRTQALTAQRKSRIKKIACAAFALLLPALCAAHASDEADTHLLVEKLNEQGCGHGLYAREMSALTASENAIRPCNTACATSLVVLRSASMRVDQLTFCP